MKKFFVLIVLLLFAGCRTAENNIKFGNTGDGRVRVPDFAAWTLYSTGLYHKTAGDYSAAIKYFMDTATFGEELDDIYYQISECYYYLNNNDTAIQYAEMSIKADKNNSKPYLLLNKIYMDMNENKKAVEILEALIAVHPEMVNVHYSIGLLCYNKLKDFDKAIVPFRSILDLSNAMPVEDYYTENASYYLARIYYGKGLYLRSADYLQRVLEINPDNRSAMFFLINILMESYRLEEAGNYSLQYLNKFEGNNIIYSILGRIYYIENNAGALAYLGRAMSSDNAYGNISKALYHELMRNDNESMDLLKAIAAGNLVLISPHIALGRIALRSGDMNTALTELFTAGVLLYKAAQYGPARSLLLEVISINDKMPDAYFYLGKTYVETGKINLAIVNLKKADSLKPDVELRTHIGYLYSQLNNFSDAAKYIDLAIEQEPENPKPYFFKGLAYSRNNDFAEAERLIKKAIDLKKDDTYYFYLATVQEKQNKLDDTITSLRKAIEYNPENDMVYNYLGYLYAENNINLDESIELIQKALALSPSNGAYMDSLGWAYYKKGELNLALKKLLLAEKRLEKDKTPDPVVFDHIGDTYHKIGETDKAIQYWKKSLSLQKNVRIEEKIKNPSGGKTED